jgi:hypothetical protein
LVATSYVESVKRGDAPVRKEITQRSTERIIRRESLFEAVRRVVTTDEFFFGWIAGIVVATALIVLVGSL